MTTALPAIGAIYFVENDRVLPNQLDDILFRTDLYNFQVLLNAINQKCMHVRFLHQVSMIVKYSL